MSSDGTTNLLVLISVIAAIAGGFSALVWLGLRAGDRDDDARAAVRLAWAERPDGWELRAIVDVTNPSGTPALVSVRSYPVPAVALIIGEPRSVQVPFRERRRLRDSTILLGAAGRDEAEQWTIPLGFERGAHAMRVDLRLDQHRRARLMRYLLPVPVTPSGTIGSLGMRDPQDA
jgi:hypothetical protein